MKRLFSFFIKNQPEVVTVVSGLPRSGTSLLMKMLGAGGVQVLTDDIRTADEDNPKGYYEFERVKKLPEGDTRWLDQAKGKVVKIISALLPFLPESHTFRIIFMERDMDEVLMSQKRMLVRNSKASEQVSDKELALLFSQHLKETIQWLEGHRHHVSYLKISYNSLMTDPGPVIAKINNFLGNDLDLGAMARVIDSSLYRNRHADFNVSKKMV